MPRARISRSPSLKPRGRPRRLDATPKRYATAEEAPAPDPGPPPPPRALALSAAVPEVQLLVAVLARALRDLHPGAASWVRADALRFWRSETDSLALFCEWLGQDPQQVRARLKARYPEVG
jgi:hypothetical protein